MSESDSLWQMDATQIAAAVRDGNISARASVESALARLDAVNPQLNAVVRVLDEEALAAADALDARIAAGDAVGILAGVPVTTKENVDQRGQPTPNGVPDMNAAMAPEDAAALANLRAADAIIIGRTNTPEFSLRFFTDNPLHGLTLNPWDAQRSCGGSSGGAASAVAMGIGAIAHGTDLGGSLRYPAFCCGLSTIRPTLGRIPWHSSLSATERPPTIQLMTVNGPLCRSVADTRLALRAMAAANVDDPWHADVPLEIPADMPRRFVRFDAIGDSRPDPEISTALDTAQAALLEAGWTQSQGPAPDAESAQLLWRKLIMTEIDVMMGSAIESLGSDNIHKVLAGYRAVSEPCKDLADYMSTLASRTKILREWTRFLSHCPIVLAPVSMQIPFPIHGDLQGDAGVAYILDANKALYAINLLGLPSAAVATGLHDGIPVGVQLIGPRFAEMLCLDAAQAIEDRCGQLARQLWRA